MKKWNLNYFWFWFKFFKYYHWPLYKKAHVQYVSQSNIVWTPLPPKNSKPKRESRDNGHNGRGENEREDCRFRRVWMRTRPEAKRSSVPVWIWCVRTGVHALSSPDNTLPLFWHISHKMHTDTHTEKCKVGGWTYRQTCWVNNHFLPTHSHTCIDANVGWQ